MKTEILRSKTLQLEMAGPCWPNLPAIRLLFALLLLPNLAGCFSTGEIKPYPSAWPAAATVPAGQCPDISGEYKNTGDAESDPSICRYREHPAKAGWNCDTSLAGNLVKMNAIEWNELNDARMLTWVKLQQPDPDTLEVSDAADGLSHPKIFKRSKGDFDCDGSSLKFSTTGTLFSDEKSSTTHDIAITAGELLLLPGAAGVISTERVFRPLQDRSLSMEATEAAWFTWLAIINVHGKRNAFVRWERYPQETVSTRSSVSPSSP